MTSEARRQIVTLPTSVKALVGEVVERLMKWPHVSGVKRLTGQWPGHYRIRTGDYRVIFRVASVKDGSNIAQTKPAKKRARVPRVGAAVWQVTIVRVGHRREIYED